MSNAKFIKCSCQATFYFYDITNHPVNINLVTQVKKWNENYCPGSEGRPAIEFILLNGESHKWIYEDYQMDVRDLDYARIIIGDL